MNTQIPDAELSRCERRVLAPFATFGMKYGLKQPPNQACLNSFCTSSDGECDKVMNSGDLQTCGKCIASGTPPDTMAAKMYSNIMTRSDTNPYPCRQTIQNLPHDQWNDLATYAITNTCTNNWCMQQLNSLCGAARQTGPQECMQCVGLTKHQEELQKNGCEPAEINAWCQDPGPPPKGICCPPGDYDGACSGYTTKQSCRGTVWDPNPPPPGGKMVNCKWVPATTPGQPPKCPPVGI